MDERILVVEDNERNRKLATAVLEVAGMQVEAATNGREAIARGLLGDLDVILLDVQLPDLGGIEVLQELRSHAPSADIPVVAVTAFAMAGDEERFRAAGFDGYLTKPIDVRLFAEQIRDLLREPILR